MKKEKTPLERLKRALFWQRVIKIFNNSTKPEDEAFRFFIFGTDSPG